MNSRQMTAYALAFAFSLSACGSKKKDKESEESTNQNGNGSGGVVGGSLAINFQSSQTPPASLAIATSLLDDATGSSGLSLVPADIGQSGSTQLESLSYRLSSLMLCGKLSTKGTATQCLERPWTLMAGENTADYDTYVSQTAANDTTNYVDFMSPTALTALARNIEYTSMQVGTYDSVLANWYRPFKMKAAVTMLDGSKLYTKAADSFFTNGGAGLAHMSQTKVSNIKTAPAAEGVFFLPNGGTYFRLQTPFEITAADVAAKTGFKMTMAFDPDGLIKGSSHTPQSSTDWLSGMVDDTNLRRIDGPFLQIAPVVTRTSETVRREVYLLTSTGSGHTTPHQVRLSLYYVGEDAAKSVRAVTSTALVSADSTGVAQGIGAVDHITSNANGTIDMMAWSNLAVAKGFKRHTATGQVDTTVYQMCVGDMTEAGCGGTVSDLSYSYTLVSDSAVE